MGIALNFLVMDFGSCGPVAVAYLAGLLQI
jgi:hypothetical protein